jgi:hypothetical protein
MHGSRAGKQDIQTLMPNGKKISSEIANGSIDVPQVRADGISTP